MVNYTGMYTKNQKGTKMRMETIIGLCGKRNEIISWCSFYVRSCLVLSGNYYCMHCHRQSMLHQICINQINNDNVHQGLKSIQNDDNFHSFPFMAGKKVGNLFCMWVPFSNTIIAMVFRSVSWAAMCSFSHGQCNKWMPKSLMI